MATPWKTAPRPPSDDDHRVTIEMGGPNIVIRSTGPIDRDYTATLAHALNAAADADTVVVIDPEPIRCDDTYASVELPVADTECPLHDHCRPAEAEVVGSGVLRLEAEHTWWTIDLTSGRICRTDTPVDVRFLDPRSWTPVIAVYVTPTKLSAITADHTVVTSRRAHADTVLLAS